MKRSNATTERLFTGAGIKEGMKVLELGAGQGEVTELLSDVVGPEGMVMALDHNEEVVSKAKQHFQGLGRSNVCLVQADLNHKPAFLRDVQPGYFDAVVGRRVLMYLPSPSTVLAGLLPWLGENGLVVFEEFDSTMGPGRVVDMPAHERGTSLLDQMLAQEKVDRSMGFHLPAMLTAAGLKFDAIWAEAVIDGQGDQYTLGELLGLLKPRLVSTEVATQSEIEHLIAQIEAERHPDNVFISGMRFCAKAIKSSMDQG